MRPWLFAFALVSTGCSAVLNFDECTTDDQCASHVDGGVGFCTADHLCIAQVPEERLCTEFVAGGADPADPNTVMIAGLFRLTGMAGDKDTEMANGARMAMKEIIQTNQRQIGMVLCDMAVGADPTVPARSLAKAASKYHVAGAVGPTTSGNMLALATTAVMYDVLLVTPSATSPAISGLPDNNLIWRTCASDALQGNTLATEIPAMTGPVGGMHSSRVNTAFVDSAYGQGLNSAFSSEWTKKTGAGPLSTNKFATPANTDAVVSRLLQDNPDFSVIVADDDASNMMKSLYALAGSGTNRFYFTDGALGPNFIGSAPNTNVLPRVFGTAPATPAVTTPPGLNFTTFRNNYKDQFMGSDPADTSFVANTYDATYVVALTASGVPIGTPVTGSAMAALLMRMSGPGQKINVGPVDFVQGVRTLRQGGMIDFVGSSGELTWDNGTGDPKDSPIEVWGINSTTVSPPAICIMTPAVQKTCP